MTRVSLFVTCLVDQLWPSVGVAAVSVLRRVGCDVTFDPRATCCGQPAYTAGYRGDARPLAERFIETYESSPADAIVCPSGSCAAMIRHQAELFDDAGWRARAHAVAERTHELSAFLVNRLGVDDVGASFRGRIAWHDACHGLRELGVRSEPRRLLAQVRGAELVELPRPAAETCCGFGGAFSVQYPEISVAILDQKIAAIDAAGVDAVVAGDASCLMQIGGRLSRLGKRTRVLHLAEVLATTA